MDYEKELEKIVKDFQSSFNFYILKNNYEFSDSAKEFLDKYLSIKNHLYKDDKTKCLELKELFESTMETTLKTVRTITEINKLWKPDYSNIDSEMVDRAKTVCESIQNLFEDKKCRKVISNIDLYNLYGSYYQLSSGIKNGLVTEDEINKIEGNLKPIIDKIWEVSLTNVRDFNLGDEFKFIVHNISNDEMNGKKLGNNGQKTRLSTSLISDKEMGLFGYYKYGFILPYESNVITSGFSDLDSYETNFGEKLCLNKTNSSLITPDTLANEAANKNIRINGSLLNYDKGSSYNEILLDSSKGLNPSAVYCITYGEKELNRNYRQAKKLAEEYGLPLIDIDISLYRTKNNIGTILTDEEPLTINEQNEFARNFLEQFYNNKSYSSENIKTLIDSDLELYQDMIVDIFLTQKKENNVDLNNLFTLYENAKKDRKHESEKYNTYLNEIEDLKEVLSNYNQAINLCTDDISKDKIIKTTEPILHRLKQLNILIGDTSHIGISNEHYTAQGNPLVQDFKDNFSPFKFETFEFNGERIEIICGHKSKHELDAERQKLLEQIDLSNDPMEKRKYHAKRVIETWMNGFITNAVNIDIASYDKKVPELEQMKEDSKNYIEVISTEKKLSDYEQLLEAKEELLTQIKLLEDSKKIYDGKSSLEHIEELQSEFLKNNDSRNAILHGYDDQMLRLKQRQEELLREKEAFEKKSSLVKFFTSKKNKQNDQYLSNINKQIDTLTNDINNVKSSIEFEKNRLVQLENNLLETYGLDGMNLDDYKQRLSIVMNDIENLTDTFKQLELKDKLKEIEEQLSKINVSKEQSIAIQNNLIAKKTNVNPSIIIPTIDDTHHKIDDDIRTRGK